LKKDINEARAEAQKIKDRISPRQLTDEQVTEVADSVRKYAGQQVGIMTYWDNMECVAFANRILETLRSANWGVSQVPEPPSPGTLRAHPIRIKNGIVIVVNSPPEKTKIAAKALVDALNQAKIGAEEQYVETQWSSNNIVIQIGTRPDFP